VHSSLNSVRAWKPNHWLTDYYGVRRLWTAATNGHIVHPLDDIWVWRTTVEWYWQGKTEELGENPVPVPMCPPEIPHGQTQAWTWASAVRGRLLTAWAMARPQPNNTSAWFYSTFLWKNLHSDKYFGSRGHDAGIKACTSSLPLSYLSENCNKWKYFSNQISWKPVERF
jgi:hypothetical protein